ncbi:MBL fold metallo-hydrolase [Luteococcus sp. H138]|uniref:MBL fold metallo-hydrolase n=1 Tax=unclassified Luteococcus TaxID=2639923 RepID=UPI00313C3AB7
MREFSIGDWQPVRDNVYVAQLQPAAVNAGLVIGEAGVLLVDCGSSPAQGHELAASAEALAGRPVTHVVVTHAHFDHFYGLAGVHAQAPEVVSIGHENLAAHLDGSNDPDVDPDVIRRDLGFEPSELVAPGTPISFLHAIDLGDRVVELVHLGPGHSDSDLFVQIPDARIVFTGDMIETSSDPMVGPDSHVDSWPQAIDGVVKNAREDALFIPGHGAVATLEEVTNQRAAISKLWSAAEDCVKNGMSMDEVIADLNGERQVDWPFAPQAVANALPWLYRTLEAKGVTKSKFLPLVN